MEYYSNASHVEVLQAILDLDKEQDEIIREIYEHEQSVQKTTSKKKVGFAFRQVRSLWLRFDTLDERCRDAKRRRDQLLGEIRPD